MKYRPCTGACTKDGTHCDGCGTEDYANSVAKGIDYKLEALKAT